MPNGLTALYEAGGSVIDIAFFYKSGMLNYGWSIASQTPIESSTIDCPECKKKASGGGVKAAKSESVDISTQTTLLFRKG